MLVHSANYGYWTIEPCPEKHVEKLLFESVMWQKSEGNVMNPVKVSMATLPFPMFNNCFENTIAVWYRCKTTRMLVVDWSVFTCRHKFDDFRHAFSLCATVDRGIIGRVSRKSPDRIHQKYFGCPEDPSTLCPVSPVIYFDSITQFWHTDRTIIIFYVSLPIIVVSTWRSSPHFWFASTTSVRSSSPWHCK